jgi:TolB-like protein
MKIASPGFSGVNVGDREAVFFSEHFAQQLARAGAKVITDQDISAVLGHERTKQLAGCAESSSSCVAELAGALGVDAIVMGNVAKLSQRYQINVKLLSATDATLLVAESVRADTNDQVVDALTALAPQMAQRGAGKLGRSLMHDATVFTGPAPSGQGGLPMLPIALAGVGVAGAGLATVGFFRASDDYAKLQLAPDQQTALDLRNSGIAWRTTTQISAGVGIAAFAGAALSYVLQGGGPKAVAVWSTPHASYVTATWSTP